MTQTETLKPCPFCGSNNVRLHQGHNRQWSAQCHKCFVVMPGADTEWATRRWNARPTPASPQTAADVQAARHESETRGNERDENSAARQEANL